MSEPGPIRRVEVTRFTAAVSRICIEIEPAAPPPASPEVERVWRSMTAANPRLYSGPILSVVSINAGTGVIRARRDTYQRLVVQPVVPTGVRQLSVTGVVVGADEHRHPTILLGRRSPQTRMYAGLWELGPAGGIEPPPPGVISLDHGAVVGELRREAKEEANLEIFGRGVPLAIVYDPLAESYDLVLKVSAAAPTAPRSAAPGWEYQELRWVPARELRAVAHSMGPDMIPPTREIIFALDLAHYAQQGESVEI